MEVDRNAWDSILSVPWLRDSVFPTGVKWGKRIVDVEISGLPIFLVAQVMLVDEGDPVLVMHRCDRYDYEGWTEAFNIVLRFPDGSMYELEVPPSYRLKDGHSLRIPVGLNTVIQERAQQADRKIPRIIYNLSAPPEKQLSHEVRRLLKNVRRITNLLQCNYLYLVLEDEACTKEVENSNIPGFKEAYHSLRAGAYKADLMRYYLLYRYGGIYHDDKTLIRQSLESDEYNSILGHCDLFIGNYRIPEIAFMGARQGSPIMLKALQRAIDNITRRDYTDNRLGITGNSMFARMMREGMETSLDIPSDVEVVWGKYWGEICALLPILLSNNGILAKERFLWQRQAIPNADWPKPPIYYANLWEQRAVYTDGNPTISFRLGMPPHIRREVIAYTILGLVIVGIGFLLSRYPSTEWV